MPRHYNAALDGTRGLAILAVLFTHAVWLYPETGAGSALRYPITFGWSGVDLFFVLSGFLITGILLDTRTALNRTRAFYVRRFLRILPLYYLALFIAFGVAALKPQLESLRIVHSWENRAFYLAFLQNFLPLMPGRATHDSAVGHFWSLAVEEQFYLLWPWLVWRVTPKSLLRLSIAGMFAAFALRCFFVARYGPHSWIHVLTVTRGEGLLMGAVLATLVYLGRPAPKRLLGAMAVAGSLLLLFIAGRDGREFLNTDAGPYMYTLGVSAISLVSGALVGSSLYPVPFLTKLVTANWLKQMGKYSYGIYVYHVPVYYAVHSALARAGMRFPLPLAYSVIVTVVLMASSFLVAWFSFRVYEVRFLRLKDRFQPEYPRRATEQAAFTSSSARA